MLSPLLILLTAADAKIANEAQSTTEIRTTKSAETYYAEESGLKY
jgi:hypothetical protein